MVPSLFNSAKILGADKNLAMLMQVILSGFTVGVVIWTFMRERNYNLQIALLLVCILLFSPYLVNYDMVILGVAVYLYYRHLVSTEHTISRGHLYFILCVASLPLTSFFLNMASFPVTFIVLLIFVFYLIKSLRQCGSSSRKRISVSDFKTIF